MNKEILGTDKYFNSIVDENAFYTKHKEIELNTVYYEPQIFNEQIALECGLIPFTYKEFNLLALSGYGMNLLLKLDAYQVLVQRRIDRSSKFFSARGEEYFGYVVGEKVMGKINEILNKEIL